MASSLEQLKKFTTVVADTGDIKRKEVDLTLYISSYVVHWPLSMLTSSFIKAIYYCIVATYHYLLK